MNMKGWCPSLKMRYIALCTTEILFLFDIPEIPCLCCSHGNLPWGNCVEGRCLVLVAVWGNILVLVASCVADNLLTC